MSVREATAADGNDLERLAELDSSRPLAGPVLIAEVAGDPRAAISLRDGRVVADPFEPAAHLVAMLRLRAAAANGVAPAGRIRRLGRSRWGTKQPRPSAASVPGIPALPSTQA